MADNVNKRLNYFKYQFLDEKDFQDEQTYHREMRRLHNQECHTPGVTSGLEVTKTGDRSISVSGGHAIDKQGREIWLEQDISPTIDPAILSNADIYVAISYGDDQLVAPQTISGKDQGFTRTQETAKLEVVTNIADPKVLLTRIKPQGGKIPGNPGDKFEDQRQVSSAKGPLSATQIPDSSISEGKIATNAVTEDKIVANAVTVTKIATNAVTEGKIVANAVTVTKIATNAVTEGKIATNAVTEGKIATNAVTEGKIATNAVTEGKIATNAVTEGKIATNAVTEGKIATNAVTEGKIATNAVTEGKIATNAVTEGKIATNAVTEGKIATNAVTGGKIATNAITEGKIATNAVTEGKIATNAVTEGKIATNAVTEGKIETNAVTEGKIETNAVTEGKIATNAVTEGKIATNAVTAAKLDSTVQSRLLPTTEIFTFAPSLFPNSGATPWLQNNGIATNDPNRSDASGWLPLQLPDGLVIQSVTVFGTKIGNFNFRITLQQQPLTGTGNSVILFGKQLSPVPDGAFSNLALDLQAGVSTAINNKNSKYFITLLIPSITAPATASIYAIQVSLARP